MIDKPCGRCGRRPHAPGHAWCHPCKAEYAREWRQRPAVADRIRAAELRRYEAMPPYRKAVKNAVYVATRAGRLPKPGKRCERCGRGNVRVERHHDDYAAPLAVEPMCTACHKALHRKSA